MHVTGLFTSNRNRLILLAAAFVFVLVQTATQQHSHDGDLSIHMDCQICLKLGSQNDVAVAQSAIADSEPAAGLRHDTLTSQIMLAVPQPRSRAPPHAI